MRLGVGPSGPIEGLVTLSHFSGTILATRWMAQWFAIGRAASSS